mgnify:CR=1 FL=1
MSKQWGLSSLTLEQAFFAFHWVHTCMWCYQKTSSSKGLAFSQILLMWGPIIDIVGHAPIDCSLAQYIFDMFFSCSVTCAISRIMQFLRSTTPFCHGIYQEQNSPWIPFSSKNKLWFLTTIELLTSNLVIHLVFHETLTWESEKTILFSNSLDISKYAASNFQWR